MFKAFCFEGLVFGSFKSSVVPLILLGSTVPATSIPAGSPCGLLVLGLVMPSNAGDSREGSGALAGFLYILLLCVLNLSVSVPESGMSLV